MAVKLPRIVHERRIQLLCLAAGAPAVIVSLVMLWTGDHYTGIQWALTAVILAFWLGFAGSARERVVSPLRTISNLLEAVREGDYSVRARRAKHEDALGEVLDQVNAIGSTLKAQRLGAVEATTLLRRVMEEIDVAVFSFDDHDRLKLINRAGERLLAQPAELLLGRDARSIRLDSVLGGTSSIVEGYFPGSAGRWGVSRSVIREEGRPLKLLVLTEMTRPLREEELAAWQRIVRVLGHELNNSLAPIKSLAGSMSQMLKRDPPPEDWRKDILRGLEIITARSEALSRFMGAYAQLARLPRPNKSPTALRPLVEHVARLETRLEVGVRNGSNVIIDADADQLEQALINLIRNAADAAADTGGGVWIEWQRADGHIEIAIRDEGTGISNTANLFVPFFTTKPGGSGIGLVLARQITEAHGGSLTLTNRQPGPGCEAKLTLPL